MRRSIYIGLSVVAALLAIVAGLFGALQTDYARNRILLWIADATAGSATEVRADAIEGVLPFDMRLVGLRLSDRSGTWLTADHIALAWSPSSLLGGTLRVDQLAAGTVDLARLPEAETAEAPRQGGPVIPELPVAVDVREASIARLSLGSPILGEPAALSIKADAKLGKIADGLSASLSVQQLSGNTGTAAFALAYRPAQDFLSLTGSVEEPKGGVVGHLLGLKQGSDLRIALDGKGPLDAWRGRMNAMLEGSPLLDLTADIQGHETRAISFSLRATPDILLQEQLRPLVAGGVDAKGTLKVAPTADTIEVSDFTAATAAGRVSASGLLGLSQPGDLAIAVSVADSRPFAALVPDVAWSSAALQARLKGTLDTPHVTADLTLQKLMASGFHVETTKLALDASAKQGLEQPIDVQATLAISGIESPDARLTDLLTNGVQLSIAGSADQAGTLVADRADLQSGALTLSGSGRAEKWGTEARTAIATLSVADIAAIGAPFGLPGTGAAEISLKLEPASAGEQLVVDGTASALSLGQPILDRLLGQAPTLHLALEGNLPQAVTIKAAQLAGSNLQLDATGSVENQTLDLGFKTDIKDTAAIDPSVRGAVTAEGSISGTMNAPTVVAAVSTPTLTVADHTVESLKLNITARDLLATPKAEIAGAANMDRLPAKLAASVALDGTRATVQNLAVTLGKSKATGDLAIAQGLTTGKLMLDAPDLSEIGTVVDVAMSGSVTVTLALDGADGKQGVKVAATGHGISAAEAIAIDTTDATAAIEDLFGTPTLAADVNLSKPVIAGHPLERLSLKANGPLSALDIKASADGPDIKATTDAQLARIADGYRVTLQSLAADLKSVQVKSQAPATIEIGAKTTRIENVALAINDGTVKLNGSVAPDSIDLALTMKAMPVSLARTVVPDLPLTGRVDGEVQVSGNPTAPSGRFSLAGKGIGATDLPQQQVDVRVDGTLQQGRLDVKGVATPQSGGQLDFTTTLSALSPDAHLQAHAEGMLDLSLVDSFLAGGADRVKGRAEVDLSAAGTVSSPELSGQLRLVDAGYENLRYGVKLRKIQADIRANGPVIQIASLTAATPGGGQIDGKGEIDLKNGVEVQLSLQARNATAIDTDLATATIDSDLAISGNLQQRLKLAGKVTILKADIRVPNKLPPSVQTIEVKEINAPPEVAARIAAREQPPRKTMIVDLDLDVEAPQQLAVRGRGLDVELGGAVHIGGTSDKPVIDGAFKLRRGSLDLAGKNLKFTDGQLTFEGGDQIDPILDLTAVTRATDLQVTVKVEGSARAPRISLSSVPAMPEDEILARLLFSKSAGALSPFELLQLAQATADLAGVSSGPGVLDRIRQSTGLDRLTVEQAEGATGPSLGAGRYVAEGVYVGVSQGAQSRSSAATVEIEVTPHVKVESEVGADASGRAGVNFEWDY
ncbi:MAG: translocation/assembly module TamB domain-containing protein [Dongiaceae bacterium]